MTPVAHFGKKETLYQNCRTIKLKISNESPDSSPMTKTLIKFTIDISVASMP